MHLAEEFAEEQVDSWVRSASLLHSNGDAMDIAVVGGRIAGVRGREDDRVNRGRLDPKDLYGWLANNSPDRLMRPLVRRGGELVTSDWDEAMGVVAERSRELLAEPGGAGRFGFYTTGQPGSYTDVDHCDAIVLWGHSVAETQAVLWMACWTGGAARPAAHDRGRPAADARRAGGGRVTCPSRAVPIWPW